MKPHPKQPANLAAWQRLMHTAITRPLAQGDHTQRRWLDGRRTTAVVNPLVKASATLEPIERVEIYNRMYWFRLLDCVADDCPGLRAFLGEKRFWAMTQAYLERYPSRSFTLRNLCSRLPKFVREEPQWTAPDTAVAWDLARFEWAQIVAFDGPTLPRLRRKDLDGASPERLRVRLQPYLTVLTVSHAVDEYVVAVKKGGALRGEASNAVTERKSTQQDADEGGPRHERLHVAVHRMDNQLYYKRLEPAAARLLRSLALGHPLAEACGSAFRSSRLSPSDQAKLIQSWFSLWMKLGWVCTWE